MGDTIYRVLLSYETQGNLGSNMQMADAAGARLQQRLNHVGHAGHDMAEKLGHAMESVGERLEHVADTAFELTKHFAEVGIAAGVGLAAYGVAHLNRELEETQIGLATVFQTQGFARNFNDAMAQSSDQIAKMKSDVKTLPGDLGQLSDIMKMIATPAAQGGASEDKIRELAGRGMLVGRILNVPQEVMARELAQLFSGRAGSHNILGSRLGLVGDAAHKFNEQTATERVGQIEKLFNTPAMNAASKAFANTWVAQTTTLADNIKYLMLGPSTAPLFERVKKTIIDVNNYIDEHKDKIQQITRTVGERLVQAWEKIEGLFKRVAPVIGNMADRLLSMDPARLGSGLEKAALMMGGTKLLGMGMTAAPKMATGLLDMFGKAGAGGGASAEAVAAMDALGASMGALAIAAVAAYGVIDVATSESATGHDMAARMIADAGSNAKESISFVSQAFDGVADAGRFVADAIGIFLIAQLDALSIALKGASQWAYDFRGAIDKIWRGAAYGDFRDSAAGESHPSKKAEFGHRILSLDDEGAVPVKVKAGAGGGGGGTHIQKVEIVVAGNQDPSRVARNVLVEIQKLAQNAKSSRYVPNFERAGHSE